MRKSLPAFLSCLLWAMINQGQALNSASFSMTVEETGRIIALKGQYHDWGAGIPPGILLQIKVGGKLIAPITSRMSKNTILLGFPGGESATINYANKGAYIRLELAAITSGVEAIEWGPFNTTIDDTIGGTVGVVRSSRFAIGIRALNKKTSGGLLTNDEGAVFSNGTTATASTFGSSLQAFTINRSIPRSITVWDRWPNVPVQPIPDGQMEGSAIALFGCKPAEVLATIRTITLQENLPFAVWDKQWIKESPAPGRPYMITTFDEGNVDTFLNLAKRMGMAGVYHEEPFDTWGHFRLKKALFPHDRAGFRASVEKAHAMGLRLGFHVLSNFITTNDSFVTPKPDPGLASAGNDTLETTISADAATITVRHADCFLLHSDLNTIRIGDELIRYGAVTSSAPYILSGCTRGAFGTHPETHSAGARVDRLIDHPYMVLFPGWDLQKKIAGNIARFINETGADQMDFDGHEGTYATGMGDLSLNTFAEDVFRQADHPVVFGSSRANHYFWQFDDYLNWGEPWYGGFRESQSDQRINNQHFYEENYLPNMLGWFLITAQTTPADIDWMLARAAGYHAGYALVVRKEALGNRNMDEIVSRIRLWNDAIDKNRFSTSQRQWLRDPGNDAALLHDNQQDWLQRFRKFEFIHEAQVLQPGQPTATAYDFETPATSPIATLVITADGATGTIDHPVIELDHAFHLALPVTLAPGESLVIGDGDEATLYDGKGRFSRHIALSGRLPMLIPGSHTLLFDAVMDASASVKARITIKLLSAKELLGSVIASVQASVLVGHLRCEYLTDPCGIDETCPRLAWTLAAAQVGAKGQAQTAYRILVSSSASLLAEDKGDSWDSHWVASDNMQQIEYRGRALISDRPYYWKVRVKDEAGNESAWSPGARWTTGLLTPMDWTAHWIGAGETYDPAKPDCNIADPWLRKTFALTARPARAILFVASVGYHEVYVNGEKIGDEVLAPSVTDNSRRARYIAYDIASRLHEGPNVIALWLGTSWSIYSSFATDDKPRAPLVIAQADIYPGDQSAQKGAGQRQGAQPPGARNLPCPVRPIRIQTDETWKTHPSPNQLLGSWSFGHMGGELWDSRKDLPHWNDMQCLDSGWAAATVYHPKLSLSAQMVEGNRLYHEIRPVAIEARADGSYRIDMGVNFAGWTEIHLHGQPGRRIDLQFSEREKQDMTFNIYSAFIPGATGAGVFRNHFNYSSGRWITIKGLSEKPALDDIRGWVVRTAYDSATIFECSDSLQNWIYDRSRWNYENLSLGGYLVDCPQRERLGYGGDANATCETGLLNYQTAALYTQWMEDWRDVQGTRAMDALNYGGRADDGILPHTAPTYQGGGGPSWGGITVVLPWYLYLHEGDTRILSTNFMLIQRWLAFLDTHVKDNLLVHFGGPWDFLGDWLWPHAGAEGMNNDKPQNICYNNCYRVYDLRTAAKIARVLGRIPEAEHWEQEADAAAQAINAVYYHPQDHSYADSSMGNLAIALLAGIPESDQRAAVMQRLEKEILVVRKGHIHVGITGGAFLFRLLRLEGRDDLLYSMTSQTDYPGWGFMKANGATSLWEMWERDLPGHSLLHSSYLYPAAWDVQGLGGIHPDPQYPGYRHFIVRVPLLREDQLHWAMTTFASPAGLIKTAWERQGGSLRLTVTVPPNTHATVYFPGADGRLIARAVSAGTYEFTTGSRP
jgi:alpha-L-rhamnosidase